MKKKTSLHGINFIIVQRGGTMSNIGFDFGTTNSIISYHDTESGTLRCFRRTANDTDYIPTVIAYIQRRENTSIQIGKAAKMRGDGNPNIYGRFKLRLGTRFNEPLPGKEKTAHEVAKDYIQKLLQDFRDSGKSIDQLVMTIPEAWYREQSNYTTRENIRTILTEIGLNKSQFAFQSEPVAAAAYFCWQWEKKQNDPFAGKLLVIDYGGGTLDVTLCEVTEKGRKIRTIDNFGSGNEENGVESGHAGSAFLARIITNLCSENAYNLTDIDFALTCNELEEYLINEKEFVDEQMKDYLIDPESVDEDGAEPLFILTRLNNCEVTCAHLYKAFNEINAAVLDNALRQITEVDAFDFKNTKIVFVGGFSNFFCVENQVRQYFHSNSAANDPRFPRTLSDENKALAIAKGAALISDNKICIDLVFPYEVGFIVGRASLENPEELFDDYIPLIKKNDKLADYNEAKFLASVINIYASHDLYTRMYRKIGGETQIFRLNNRNDLEQIFPEAYHSRILIGISVDQDMIPTLYTKDESGTIRSASLNKILERLNMQIED